MRSGDIRLPGGVYIARPARHADLSAGLSLMPPRDAVPPCWWCRIAGLISR